MRTNFEAIKSSRKSYFPKGKSVPTQDYEREQIAKFSKLKKSARRKQRKVVDRLIQAGVVIDW